MFTTQCTVAMFRRTAPCGFIASIVVELVITISGKLASKLMQLMFITLSILSIKYIPNILRSFFCSKFRMKFFVNRNFPIVVDEKFLYATAVSLNWPALFENIPPILTKLVARKKLTEVFICYFEKSVFAMRTT